MPVVVYAGLLQESQVFRGNDVLADSMQFCTRTLQLLLCLALLACPPLGKLLKLSL